MNARDFGFLASRSLAIYAVILAITVTGPSIAMVRSVVQLGETTQHRAITNWLLLLTPVLLIGIAATLWLNAANLSHLFVLEETTRAAPQLQKAEIVRVGLGLIGAYLVVTRFTPSAIGVYQASLPPPLDNVFPPQFPWESIIELGIGLALILWNLLRRRWWSMISDEEWEAYKAQRQPDEPV